MFVNCLDVNTPLAALGLYLYYNQAAIARRFFEYLETEFLGGIENEQCRKDSILWFQDVLNVNGKSINDRLWAFQSKITSMLKLYFIFCRYSELLFLVLDATSKPPTGIMNANINWVGSYKQCNKVLNNKVNPHVKGRYCNAVITSPVIQEYGVSKRLNELLNCS
jgi:hypothetical protein